MTIPSIVAKFQNGDIYAIFDLLSAQARRVVVDNLPVTTRPRVSVTESVTIYVFDQGYEY